MYKSVFKELKRKRPPPDYSGVIDIDNFENGAEVIIRNTINNKEFDNEEFSLLKHVKPISEWKIFELTGQPGLLFIKNPFTWIGQRYWICRCLQDFSRKPSRLNLDAHNELEPGEDWWERSQGKDSKNDALRKKLRWATMGYHHDWNTKVYSEDARDPFPEDLAALSRLIGKAVGFTEPFEAQAAIVNFYHLDSTLSGHTDHSEEHATAPLFSFSFGQSSIFLLGGQTIDEKPTAMYIRSGDVIIMSGYSRLCYHGIPKILKSTNAPWEPTEGDSLQNQKPGKDSYCVDDSSDGNFTAESHELSSVQNAKIEEENNRKTQKKSESPQLKKRRVKDIGTNCLRKVDYSNVEHLCDDTLWLPFRLYVESSRINMNVRQVLCAGQTALKNISKEGIR